MAHPGATTGNDGGGSRVPRWLPVVALAAMPGCSLLVDANQYSVSASEGPGPTQAVDPLSGSDTGDDAFNGSNAFNGSAPGDNPSSGSASSADNGRGPSAPGALDPASPASDCAARPAAANCATMQTTDMQATDMQATDDPAGAPAGPPTSVASGCMEQQISFDELYRQVNADLLASAAANRPFLRYLSLNDRFVAGQCSGDLERERQALSKALNMLSIRNRVVAPTAIDPARTLYRIDLRDYDWDRPLSVNGASFVDAWETIVNNNPYAVRFEGPEASAARLASNTTVPLMFADQLLAVAMVGNLYYALIDVDVNATLGDFALNDLAIDVAQNLLDEEMIRAGTTNSRISTQDRMVERHAMGVRAGALWQSFAVGGPANQSIFEDPFGFAQEETEAIFTLPNGLLGFIIADANGNLLEESDTLLDTNRNNLQVTTAISCANCHAAGLIPVVDEVRDFVLANSGTLGLNVDEVQQIQSIYVTPQEFARQIEADTQTFYRQALTSLNLPTTGEDPVSATFLRFSEDLTLVDAAGELGVLPATLQSQLDQLDPGLSVLANGVLDRAAFTALFVPSLCILSADLQNRPEASVCGAAGR